MSFVQTLNPPRYVGGGRRAFGPRPARGPPTRLYIKSLFRFSTDIEGVYNRQEEAPVPGSSETDPPPPALGCSLYRPLPSRVGRTCGSLLANGICHIGCRSHDHILSHKTLSWVTRQSLSCWSRGNELPRMGPVAGNCRPPLGPKHGLQLASS